MRVIYAARQMEVNESLERINCRLYACRLGGALVVGTRLDATVRYTLGKRYVERGDHSLRK
jgi:hypothetical protein